MSSYIDATSSSVEHCEQMGQQFPELAEPYYQKIASYCQQKLWHQLTLLVLDFVSNAEKTLRPCDDGNSNTFLSLYQKVVLVVATKLNAIAMARIAAAVAFESLSDKAGGTVSVEESKVLLEELLKKQKEKPDMIPSVLFLESQIALLTMTKEQPAAAAAGGAAPAPTKEDLAAIYSIVKKNAPLLNQLIPDTPESNVVNASHYEMTMTYYKLVGPPEAFYDEAMHYLNYYQPTTENQAKSHSLAVDLCLAALTGEGVYNLGQVVTNPILQTLKGTNEAWLMDLLQACAKGSVLEFKKLCSETYVSQIASQPALVNMNKNMQEKMTLLALVQMVFERPSSERNLTFNEIATRLEIPTEQVEWVIMRAFSVKLLEGTMDQVDNAVHVTWVLPRVLTNEQMTALAKRYGEWAGKVSSIKGHMQEQTPTFAA